MPVFDDQQAVQQLLSGLNTMQMQAGLMPGGIPMYNPAQGITQPRTPGPGEFSNNLRVQYQSTFSPIAMLPPMYSGVSPVPRNEFAQTMLPGAQLTSGWGLARQGAQSNINGWMTGTQSMIGLGARGGMGLGMSAMGGVLGTMFGGPLGGLAGSVALPWLADSFVGQGVENLATLPFRGLVNQRARGMELQAATTAFVRSGPELSASGTGLTMNASMDLERNLARMAENRSFKRDTRGTFNRQDMVKITQLSSQLGLLDEAQNVDQITREVGKIGRALSTFMKIAEEPDVQNALQMMGRMRNMGMTLPEVSSATANARTFARMAGTTVQGMLSAGMQGAGMYQQMGMTGGVGMQVGMAATGMASMMAGQLSPRHLAMLGGREGIANNLSAAAANITNLDVLLPGLLRQGKEGLEIDQNALMAMASGKQNINQLVQQSQQRLSGMGPKGFIQEYGTRRNELRDQLMGSMGGQGGILMSMMTARALSQSGNISYAGALRMLYGEEQARTIELASTPENFARLRQQQQEAGAFERRAGAVQQRTFDRDAAQSARLRQVWKDADVDFRFSRGIGRTISNWAEKEFQEEVGFGQDLEEQRQLLGGGDTLATAMAPDGTSPLQLEQIRGRMSTDKGRREMYSRMASLRHDLGALDIEQKNRAYHLESTRRAMNATVALMPFSLALDAFTGERGFGLTSTQRGGEGLDQFVNDQDSAGKQFLNFMGWNHRRTQRELDVRAADIQEGGDVAARALSEGFRRERGADLQRATGLTAEQYRNVRARGAAFVSEYARDKSGSWLFGNNRGTSISEMRQQLAADLKGKYNLTDEQIRSVTQNSEMMSELMRTSLAGNDDRVRAVISQMESSGADKEARERVRYTGLTQERINQSREKLYKGTGVDMYDLDTGQRRQFGDIMGAEGAEGEAGRLLFQSRALSSLHTKEADERAAQLFDQAQGMLTDEQFEKQRSFISGFTESVDSDVLEDMGNTLMKSSEEQRKKRMADVQIAADEVKRGTLHQALVQRLGEKGAAAFESGAAEGRGTKNLADYIRGAGGKLKGSKLSEEDIKNIMAGKLKDTDLEQSAVGELPLAAQAAFEGANTHEAPQGAGTDALVNQMTQVLTNDSAVMQSAFGKFGGSVDKFHEATSMLKTAAESLNGGRITETDRAMTEGKSNAQRSSLSEAH